MNDRKVYLRADEVTKILRKAKKLTSKETIVEISFDRGMIVVVVEGK